MLLAQTFAVAENALIRIYFREAEYKRRSFQASNILAVTRAPRGPQNQSKESIMKGITADTSKTIKKMFFFAALLASVVGSLAAQTVDNGKKGPTHGFFVSGGNSVTIGTDFTEIQRLSSLPAGNYIANASAVLASNDPQFHFADCIFMIGGFTQGEVARGLIGGTVNNFISLPLTVGLTITTTSDLVLACRSEVSGVVSSSSSSPITAIRVDRLTIQRRNPE